MQDISLAAHPLDQDQATAIARQPPGWADYSGVSRTLSSLSRDDAHQIVEVLEEINRCYIDMELQFMWSQGKRIQYAGDLTCITVSNASRTYPNAAFGHKDDEIRRGYQAVVVSLKSPTFDRF